MFLFSLMIDRIGHFRIAPTICFKTRLSAKPLICKPDCFFSCRWNKKGFALSLVSKVRVFWTRKWPIVCWYVRWWLPSVGKHGKAPNSKSAIIAVVNISVNRKLYYFFAARNQVIRFGEKTHRWIRIVLFSGFLFWPNAGLRMLKSALHSNGSVLLLRG